MAKHSVVLGKSQVALVQLAKDVKDQLTMAADNGFQQRVAVIADELGAPANTRINIVNGMDANGVNDGTVCAVWDTPDIGASEK